jgi:hypothetical protein
LRLPYFAYPIRGYAFTDSVDIQHESVLYLYRILTHLKEDGQCQELDSLGKTIMKRKHIEFEAHQTVKKPTRVAFETKDGHEVRFKANRPTKVPVHVSFLAKQDQQ